MGPMELQTEFIFLIVSVQQNSVIGMDYNDMNEGSGNSVADAKSREERMIEERNIINRPRA